MTKLRRAGGYGAAIAATPYLLLKLFWTAGLLLPTEQMSEPGWRAINGTTAAVAAIGILLALAFSRPWGERLPAGLVGFPVWVGTGLLVPTLLLAPVVGPAAVSRDRLAGAPDFWIYEQVLVAVSLVGVAIGLPLALAGYVATRWPEVLSGRIHHRKAQGESGPLQTMLARMAAAGCILLGIIKIGWATGAGIGIDPAMVGGRDLWWRSLALSTGVWAILGAWGLLTLTARRRPRRFLPPMAAAWISSGTLFAHNLYDVLTATRADAPPTPEYPLARVVTTQAGIILGMMMGMTILLILHDRQRLLRELRSWRARRASRLRIARRSSRVSWTRSCGGDDSRRIRWTSGVVGRGAASRPSRRTKMVGNAREAADPSEPGAADPSISRYQRSRRAVEQRRGPGMLLLVLTLVLLAVWPQSVGVLFLALSGYLVWSVSRRLTSAANDHWRPSIGG